jgi:hypothetical protein
MTRWPSRRCGNFQNNVAMNMREEAMSFVYIPHLFWLAVLQGEP